MFYILYTFIYMFLYLNVVEGSTRRYCCGVLEKYPDFIPYKTWGSLVNGIERAKWDKTHCSDWVGGSSKSKCVGKFFTYQITVVLGFVVKCIEGNKIYFVST